MNKIKPWATPVTIGAFMLMATTGILMFFHLESGLNKVAHEWLGWAMVTGVIAHAWLNWKSFKRYFTERTAGKVIIATFGLVLVASFWSPSDKDGESLPPPVAALRAVMNAPITSVAQLAGKPEAELILALRAGGIPVERPDQTLSAVVHEDREQTGKAIQIILAKK